MKREYEPSLKVQIAKGQLTYEEACARAPYASQSTKTKWRKMAKAK